MADQTHQTAPTQFVDGSGIRFAYRRFEKKQGVPLVFFRPFTRTMDNWDPAVTNGLARDREMILFNNAGISNSGGETPNTIAEMARHAAAFIAALGLEQIDLLGFSSEDWLPAVDSGLSQVWNTSTPSIGITSCSRPASREKGRA